MNQDRSRRALLVAWVPALILALAGCGSSGKMSAGQTEQQLGKYLSPSYRIQCDPASGSFWDYACKVTPPAGAKNKPYKLKVTVDSGQILDRAYCGARSGTSLNC
jgi:hypothetical protein